MEVCSNVTGTQNNGWGIVVANGQANSSNQSRMILTMKIGRGFQTSYAKTHDAFVPEAGDVCVSATKDDLYVKGTLIQDTTFASVDWNGGMANFNIFGRGDAIYKTYGQVYCVRLYSRALTAEEIARNYEIDKRRFGLA